MAIAAEELPAAAAAVEGGSEEGARATRSPGQPWVGISQASGRAPAAARAAVRALPSAGQQRGTQVLTRIVWAIAAGLVVLEVAAQATGQTWSWTLRGFGRQAPAKVPYQPLYAGMPMAPQDPLVGLHGASSTSSSASGGSPGPLLAP